MGWYNNVAIMDGNVKAFFYDGRVLDFKLLNKQVKDVFNAEKEKNKSGKKAKSIDCSEKQRLKHEVNCRDWQQKKMILDELIKRVK